MAKVKQRFFNLWKPRRYLPTPERDAFDFFHPTTPAGRATPETDSGTAPAAPAQPERPGEA